ncbi:deoxyguanosinetriphosphate triphosphohydrolase-like protein [Iodidimonas gelatinilytica]|uniref:Deoxyguanosinetriphosphate triphosphohydrolase-like protein n=1 Tax=Iodidimonas gelatinilytica TaxID=1236966 RepID=A0A5A7MZ94_9PROT|nr:deoxyguanosinetriphosphate triphosphohydrolase [Iodidimonas gelatinilytica]GER01313.1 deoxyguanosinetriphosphate triphosphohydrolase-like protein [Iodidimonas gelatinilytica]
MAMETLLAPWAAKSNESRGRLIFEPESATRTVFQRDRDRIIHSSTFRRLKHKTQVFVYHEGDHYRTRLTHSIEVSQIARALARSLRLNEDLAEALALAHDLGHPPFGHAGEAALDRAMQPYGGFDHNAQTIRLVTALEHPYAGFSGLNLCWETLEGLAKHNGPLVDAPIDSQNPPDSLPFGLKEYLRIDDLELHTWPSAEAQVAAIADDVAYNNHDIDDGLRAGLFSLEALAEVPLVRAALDAVDAKFPDIPQDVRIHELVRRLIGRMTDDILTHSRQLIADLDPVSVDDIRGADHAVVYFSPAMKAEVDVLRNFLFTNMYRHRFVRRMTGKAKRVVHDLFTLYMSEPELLPPFWAKIATGPETTETARAVADFIGGMTDRFALRDHEKLFSISASPK